MRRTFAIACAGIALLVVPACKPRTGGACEHEGAETCIGDSRALACHEGRWEEMACRGQDGCRTSGSVSRCDQSHARVAEACNPQDDVTCSENDMVLLGCVHYRWTIRATCDGPKRCQRNSADVTCDDSTAREAAPCLREGSVTCSDSSKAALVCRGGAFAVLATCKGPDGCRIDNEKVRCDDAQADERDPCIGPENRDHFACSSSRKEVLRCEKGTFVVARACADRTACSVNDKGAGCAP